MCRGGGGSGGGPVCVDVAGVDVIGVTMLMWLPACVLTRLNNLDGGGRSCTINSISNCNKDKNKI